jgi:hypothetical protein
VAKIGLQRPRIVPPVGQSEAAGVAQHVRMGLELEAGHYHAGEACGGERGTTFGREHEGRLRILLPGEPTQCPEGAQDEKSCRAAVFLAGIRRLISEHQQDA